MGDPSILNNAIKRTGEFRPDKIIYRLHWDFAPGEILSQPPQIYLPLHTEFFRIRTQEMWITRTYHNIT